MAPRISLALAIHNHQPVGNFGWVMAEVYDQAYLPMVEALERHGRRPAVAALLGTVARVAARGTARVHRAAGRPRRARPGRDPRRRLLRAGPGVAAGARSDRPGCAGWPTRLEALFGRRPSGAWLAERVWEPDLPTSLVGGRLRLDDPRRRPLPRRGDPRGGPVGPVHARTTRASCYGSSGPSRASATGSRSATSRRSSTICGTTPPRTASGSG